MNTSKGINVLFLSPSYKPYLGGTERIVEKLAQTYISSSAVNRVGVLTTRMDFNFMPPKENTSLPAQEEMDGLSVYRVSFFPRKLKFFYTLPIGLISMEARKVIDEFKPDIIHYMLTEWFVANTWIYLLTRKKCRHVYTVSFHDLPDSKRYLLMRYMNIFLGRVVGKVQVHSPYIKKRVMDHYLVPEEKVEIIPLGAVSSENKLPMKKGEVKRRISLLAVGRLSEDKGQLELIKAFHGIIDKVSKDVELILVGGDGGHRGIVEDYIRDNHLGKKIKLAGFVPEEMLHEYYRAADIFILLTRCESFGIVFAEAQSYGVPVIAYRIGPIESAFRKGALLVEPYNLDLLAEKMSQIIDDDQLRINLSEEAYEYAWDNFSWEKTAFSFLKIYDQLVRGVN